MADGSTLAHGPTLSAAPPGPGGDDELAPGTAVGEYVVERFLGAGAMGEVYAGKQPVIGKKVAIKVLKPEVAASADGAERFTREARAVNQVEHPGVIDIFSFGRTPDGRLYLVMDLVEGKSLRKALIDGPLPQDVALDVLAQIADALDAAHARGVIHRDLKPDNVMLGSGTPAKVFVLDFGLAKLLATDGSAKASMLTGQGTWLGTPGYMAPEQWSADGAGPASDRYALGVMAFELLSGSLPFSADSVPQMMEAHFRAKVPALSSRGALPASAAFDPIVARALAKDPAARFPTAGAMVDALRAAAGNRVATRPARLWIPAAAGAGVLGLSVAAIVALRRGEPPHTTAAASAKPRAERAHGITIQSAPPGAEVRSDGVAAGMTPTTIDVPAGERRALELRKPGYTSVQGAVAAGDAPPVYQLVEIRGFEGVWMVPGVGLRAFQRSGDRVAISKLDTVAGPQTFFRHLAFEPAERGVTFATSEDIVDARAPDEPSCHVPARVEYHYDPASDTLELRRERIAVDFAGGHCVPRSSTFAPPLELERADRASDTERETLPPVGKPITSSVVQKSNTKPIAPKIQQKKSAPSQKPFAPLDNSAAPPPSQPAQQQSVAPQNAAPPLKGDSQVMPQVQTKQ